MSKQPIRNFIIGLSSTTLNEQEINFIKKYNPAGIILFKRNIQDPTQVKEYISNIKKAFSREDILVLIDQEGGKVARLRPPIFRGSDATSKSFGELAKQDLELAKQAVYLNSLLIGKELQSLGINVNCAPVADLLIEGADSVIGDRSFGEDPEVVASLCVSADLGFRDAGIQSIIKHIPGHGRADKDSHLDLPIIKEDLATLESNDFKVFKDLSTMKIAMTAHIIYNCLDPEYPVTISKKCINYIRNELNFNGIILTDDLSMKALKGSLKSNALFSLEAGCDLLLHCNGNLEEMLEIAEVTRPISEQLKKAIDDLNCFDKFEVAYQSYKDLTISKLEETLAQKLKFSTAT